MCFTHTLIKQNNEDLKTLCAIIILLTLANSLFAQKASRLSFDNNESKQKVEQSIKKPSKKRKSTGAIPDAKIRFMVDWPGVEGNAVIQTLYSSIPTDTIVDVELLCYQITEGDSILCYHSKFRDLDIKNGVSTNKLDLEKSLVGNSTDPTFFEIVRKFQVIPPGEYVTILRIFANDTVVITKNEFHRDVDSILKQGSVLRETVNSHFLDSKKRLRKAKTSSVTQLKRPLNKPLSEEELGKANTALNRKLKSDEVNTEPQVINGRSYSAMYYKNRFLGRYEIIQGPEMKTKIQGERSRVDKKPASLINTEFASFTNVTSGTKDVFKKKEKKNNNKGSIDITSNWANEQEPNSEQNNNFQEFRGQLSTTILKLPVNIEGFYTTQDKNRIAKASYLRVSYDVDRVKSQMSEEVNGFKSKYNESKSKVGNFDYATQAFLNSAKNEESKLCKELAEKYGIDKVQLDQSNGDVNALLANKTQLDISQKDEILDKYAKIEKIQASITKYSGMANQYKDGIYFDSALVYDKLKNIENDDVSQKTVAKAAENMLPDGKTKKFLAGLTSLNIGILNEYESKYTLSGQTLKGGMIGYDFDLVKITTAFGKTEYVSRDGYVDRYNSSMLKFDFKPVFEQKMGLIYYINSPTKQVFQSDKFKKDVSIPTFIEPVHIISINYEGKILSNLNFHSEGAASFKKSEKTKDVNKDNTAIVSTLDYLIPRIATSFMLEWEHIGKTFENNSLPYIRNSTERYSLAGKKTLFRSFLNVGIQYNFIKQSTFTTTGYSKKWGFDIKTNSKRYPNVFISYKPFSTFRSYTDTLIVQQRPMIGEVWIARASYRIKRKYISHNFTLVYNKNSSNLDTIDYTTSTLQGGYMLSTKNNVITTNVGWASLPVSNQVNIKSYFLQVAFNRRFNEQLCMNVGQEISLAAFGLQRTSTSLGGSYSFVKLPVIFRTDLRYAKYKMNEFSNYKDIWAVQLGLNIYFKDHRE